MTGGWGISCKITLRWMPLDLTDDKSTLVQVMAWCRQATSHYLSQCWPRFMSPCGVSRPQWVKVSLTGDNGCAYRYTDRLFWGISEMATFMFCGWNQQISCFIIYLKNVLSLCGSLRVSVWLHGSFCEFHAVSVWAYLAHTISWI